MKRSHILTIIVVVFITALSAYFYDTSENNKNMDSGYMAPGSFGDSTDGPLHWHPKVSILINGEKQHIPKNIGITIGKVMDIEASGMRMSPMHTHEDDGTIHMEQVKPTERTLRLGYFFDVWDKRFDPSCIFEYCNDGNKSVKMFVNGEPNFEFDNYVPKDKDEISIVYG
ncbi:MAG: hypothetical protein WAO91_02995 [Candidatus Nitrosotenuis sp.]